VYEENCCCLRLGDGFVLRFDWFNDMLKALWCCVIVAEVVVDVDLEWCVDKPLDLKYVEMIVCVIRLKEMVILKNCVDVFLRNLREEVF
jgi:hypothetical protein